MRHVLGAAVTVVMFGVAAGSAEPALAASPSAPPGYQIQSTGPIALPVSTLNSGGQVSCPAGTVPWGGGATFTGGFPGVGENINTSAPTGNGWRGRYNNSTARPNDHFAIDVICARKPRGYRMMVTTVDNPSATQVAASTTCPSGTVVLSGGTLSTADTVDASLLSAWPTSARTFRGVMWNGNPSDQSFSVFAICAKQPSGYKIVSQTGTDPGGAPAVDAAGAVCPTHTVVTGGGLHVAKPSIAVTIGQSIDDGVTQWDTEAVTVGLGPTTATTFAICAG